MVQLLHHYETSYHRVFLLLEHMRGGRMVDLVTARRQQWKLLQASALNPVTSSLLVRRSPQPHPAEGVREKGAQEEDQNGQLKHTLGQI